MVEDGSSEVSAANQAPVFTEGDRTERTVAEQAAKGTNIGAPVTATDADGDPLTYTRGGVDAAFFAIDNVSGQLAASAELDFEVKAAYTFVMGVSDGRGGADFTMVTIQVTDIDEVPIDNPATQAAGTVYPDSQTTVETPDGVASVTFPAGSRDTVYHVRVDSDSNNCAGDSAGHQLQVCLTVDIFDSQGNPEPDAVLDSPASIWMKLDADGLGGADAVLAAHEQGGVSLRSRVGRDGEWTDLEFTLEADDQGMVTITASGIYSFGSFGAVTDPAVFEQVPRPAEPDPTPTPQPTPRPTVAPTPQPTARPTAGNAYPATHANANIGPVSHGAAHAYGDAPACGGSGLHSGPDGAGAHGNARAGHRGNSARRRIGGIRESAVVADPIDGSRSGDIGNRRGAVHRVPEGLVRRLAELLRPGVRM